MSKVKATVQFNVTDNALQIVTGLIPVGNIRIVVIDDYTQMKFDELDQLISTRVIQLGRIPRAEVNRMFAEWEYETKAPSRKEFDQRKADKAAEVKAAAKKAAEDAIQEPEDATLEIDSVSMVNLETGEEMLGNAPDDTTGWTLPTMDNSADEIKQFAADNKIELGMARNKGVMLTVIKVWAAS